MDSDCRPDVPFLSGITREEDYRLMLEAQKGDEFSDSPENALSVSEIVKKLVRKGGGNALYYNHQIFWDAEDLDNVAIEELIACANEGVDIGDGVPDENWSALVRSHNDGHECEITVEIFAA